MKLIQSSKLNCISFDYQYFVISSTGLMASWEINKALDVWRSYAKLQHKLFHFDKFSSQNFIIIWILLLILKKNRLTSKLLKLLDNCHKSRGDLISSQVRMKFHTFLKVLNRLWHSKPSVDLKIQDLIRMHKEEKSIICFLSPFPLNSTMHIFTSCWKSFNNIATPS